MAVVFTYTHYSTKNLVELFHAHQFNDHDHDTAFTLGKTRKIGFDLMT